jgi:predicted nucleic acid-binding protein
MRIVGNARYPNSPGTPGAVANVLAGLRQRPGHTFWPDDISLLDPSLVELRQLLTHAQITDAYLLAMPVAHRGKLATFDKKLSATPVRNGKAALFQIQ